MTKELDFKKGMISWNGGCTRKGTFIRPSKCPKFYTNRILGEQNLRQKVRKFGQNLNRDIMTYLIKYTLTVQFSI